MGEIILVRHGQANSTATDEAGYDRLSDLGRRQAEWLGQWFAGQGERFDLVLSGTLNRHLGTAEAMGQRPEVDPRLNEMDYFNLSRALTETRGKGPVSQSDFAAHIADVMEAWHRAEILGAETFDAFEARVIGVLAEAAAPGRRILCVTSGGVIGMMIRHLLRLDPTRMAHVLLPILNTSIHRVQVMPHGTILAGFNATPHLDTLERAHARTHF
jgi:broad specificity phosphatase PhoE